MTPRDIGQFCLDAAGGALIIVCAVLVFTYIPRLVWMAVKEYFTSSLGSL